MVELFADRQRGIRVGVIVSSPERRALQTAQLLADAYGVGWTVEPRLAETSFGDWEGRTPADVEWIPAYQRWAADPATTAPPEGEPGLQVLARALRAITDRTGAGSTQAIMFISHKHVIRLLAAHALGSPLTGYRELPAPTSSLTILSTSGARLRHVAGPDVTHLPLPWRADPDRVTWTTQPRGRDGA
jgi:broad specificity phosphatase PhoE